MTEPVSLGWLGVTSAGITVLGIVTGLHPALMLAGAAGGWWAMSYQPQISVLGRMNRVLLSSIVSAWGAPVAAAAGASVLPSSMTLPHSAIELGVALIMGLVTIDVLGRGLLSLVRSKIDHERSKTENEQ